MREMREALLLWQAHIELLSGNKRLSAWAALQLVCRCHGFMQLSTY